MNALLVSFGAGEARAVALARAVRSMEGQGLRAAYRWAGSGVEVRAFVAPGAEPMRVGDDGRWALCAGTIGYRGAFGRDALARVLDDAGDACDPARVARDALLGSFTLVLHRSGRTVLLGDPLGLHRTWVRADAGVLGTSWLAALECGDARTLDAGAALEYVLHGAVHGETSPVREVSALAPDRAFDATRGEPVALAPPVPPEAGPAPRTPEAAVAAFAEHYRRVFDTLARASGGPVRMALSGGFDSRLVLAGLAAVGVRPELFVYGPPGSADVRVARAVADGEGLALDAVDKQAADAACAPLDVDAIESACRWFDGLPVDGIVDPGTDRATRLAQVAGGALVLNGGGGEILRNFFHLPDRPMHARALVTAFWGGTDPRIARRADAVPALHERMAATIAACVGSHGPLTRRQVELAYPLVRCRYWMGRNNAVSARWGRFATPLVDPVAVRLAAALPLAWKQAGAFESRVIGALDARIAAYPSAYGFAFGGSPNLRTRWSEWTTCARPVRVRPLVSRLRRRLAGGGPDPRALAEARRLFGADWAIESLLRLDRLPDEGALNRAATLEHLVGTRALRVPD